MPIKHVFYIIKENRTYDQVLGDMKEGNGDPSLVLFGENVTPNLHALARQFVLLDNFYCDAEVSADGHNWSMYFFKWLPGRTAGLFIKNHRPDICLPASGMIQPTSELALSHSGIRLFPGFSAAIRSRAN